MAADTTVEETGTSLAKMLPAHWKLFWIEGLLLLILGIVAIGLPPLATVAIEMTVGWLILFSGVAGLITTFGARGTPGFAWSLFSAVIGIITGVILLIWPLSGVLTLTLVLTVFLAFEGVASIMYGLAHRRQDSPRWGWMLFSGIMGLVLSAIILSGLPGTATWVIGVIVGVNMIFGGTALMSIALRARRHSVQ